MPRARLRTAALAALAVLLGAGCGAETGPPPSIGGAGPADQSPLTALPDCGEEPAASGDALPEGARVPEGTIVTVVRETGPFVQVNGYVARTPIEVQEHYEAQDALTVLTSENEVLEAELLVTDGTTRSFVKAVSVCADGSALAVVLAPDDQAEGLPAPAGRPAP